ncbi:bifunctional diguanylate cyclase/phosphodiesterase [uncultured Oxalicibacterium sp.]|uniref:putative bifunctional diguanylate cyclase/phosphodiesterase n=1 Tax=uncultured Oxalicibacterium sp. TaxID=1168540 RepID=UPI0025D2A83D|nr:GGDEF and EAL domain-containing protein [uncultured Oxalicibacterium sp.]
MRLSALRRLNLLDTPPSEAFDRITRLASQIFHLPIAAISLTDSDRQWFKSRVGVDHQQIPRHLAPCAQVAETSDLLVISDLQADGAYSRSLLADRGIRFYAGAPLITDDGYSLGAMCVLGTEPRQISVEERKALQDLAAMVMAQIELRHALGRIDPVSGLPNRTQFREDFDDIARDSAGQMADLVLLNIARPEEVAIAARVMGSDYIDTLIKGAAEMISALLPFGRQVYHVGEMQFAFFVPHDIDIGSDTYRDDLTNFLSEYEYGVDSRFVTTASFGITQFLIGSQTYADVLRMAHSASQDALELVSRVNTYSSRQDVTWRRRFAVLHGFSSALKHTDRLHLVYQPRIDIVSGKCVGAEALLRWTDPELGIVSPAEFMPIVEHSAMIHLTTAWVLNKAIEQLGIWQRAGLHLQLAINISAVNLLEPGFAQNLFNTIERYGVDATCVELEITESALMTKPVEAHHALNRIVAYGIRIAIDDFGTGYSSLAYLQKLPAQILKIDGTFVKDLSKDDRQRALVLAMIKMSHELEYTVVAEGVESEAILTCLKEMGCNEAQGYFFSQPLLPGEFLKWKSESPVAS